MAEEWTPEDEATYAPLRRKKLRIEARKRKDQAGRAKRYGARTRKPVGPCEFREICYNYKNENFRESEAAKMCNNLPWHGACSLEEDYLTRKAGGRPLNG